MALSGSVTTNKWVGDTYWGSMTFAWTATQIVAVVVDGFLLVN